MHYLGRFLLLQHIYCLTQRIGSHCDTADIVIHSTVYTILVITWSRSDPTGIKKFQQQTSGKEEWREGQIGNMSPPLGGGHSRLSRLSPRPAYGMCVGL